jgi:adenylylsulfate kinase-like enzyme
VRDLVGAENFIEVFVDCPLEVCEARDVKGLYKKARAGEISNFTGISSPFEVPTNFDIRIPTNEWNLEESIQQLVDYVIEKIGQDS